MKEQGFEIVESQFFDPGALRLPPYKVGRITYGWGRSYLKIENGEIETPFRLYTSLTTAIRTCSPMERGLLEWICKLGLAESDRYVEQAAMYGTLMHITIGDFHQTGMIDFDDIDRITYDYCTKNNYWERETKGWAERLRYDMAAYIQFTRDYNVKPLALEFVLVSQRGFGTLIDLVCELDVEEKGFFGEIYKSGERKGEPKETKRIRRTTAIINFKSGRHGFYRENGIQVEAEKMLFQENFPDIEIEKAFNWSPKDWRTEPGYNLKDWTGDVNVEEVDNILKLAQIRFGNRAMDKEYIRIEGKFGKISDEEHITDISSVVRKISAEDYARRKYGSMPAS